MIKYGLILLLFLLGSSEIIYPVKVSIKNDFGGAQKEFYNFLTTIDLSSCASREAIKKCVEGSFKADNIYESDKFPLFNKIVGNPAFICSKPLRERFNYLIATATLIFINEECKKKKLS